ncbi:aldose 1-epimerase [Haoranjiania flava]|uniref:Aldose 1-epimerase n=1 Tax=Haoranjiania flava TaxID=1856322 RepID=A0AAE3IQV8_9BACT|nr:aldose 1-epimerase [Haoranjiania flava]MCU7694741.1 aldose 1-epimerase [Haoranjiania flava]
MRFEIIDNNDNLILKDTHTNTQAQIYTFGALLNRFEIEKDGKPVNVIDGYHSVDHARESVTELHKSAKLTPFVCRLNAGRFSYGGKDFSIKKFNIGPSAIHGLVFDADFTVSATHIDDHKATVSLHYDYKTAEHGFPFAFSVNVAYKLEPGNKLTVRTTITNHSKEPMPLSDGWHPYFKLGETINTAEVKFNAKEVAEFSSELLPTGNFFPYNTFNEFKTLGATELDNSFTLNDHDGPALVMRDQDAGVQLEIIPDKSYPILQIYTPPHRKSIAIENLSSVPDAFNNKIGLIDAKPEEKHIFTTSYKLSLV